MACRLDALSLILKHKGMHGPPPFSSLFHYYSPEDLKKKFPTDGTLNLNQTKLEINNQNIPTY